MNIDEKIAELKANIESCERVCEAVPTGTIRDAALRKAEDCKQMVEWLEDYKRLSSSEKANKSQERDDENCDDIWERAYKEREGKKMNGSFELTLNNPMTKEDWDKIRDVELENTPSVTFKTPKGRQVKYIKADILDKIVAEIAEIKPIDYDGTCIDRAYILQIIDKYKAESEDNGENGN